MERLASFPGPTQLFITCSTEKRGELKERVGRARTYIVPLQRDLDVTPSVDDPKSAEKIGELIINFSAMVATSGKNTHHCLTPELYVL